MDAGHVLLEDEFDTVAPLTDGGPCAPRQKSMPNSSYFRSRAVAYRRMAIDAKDAEQSGDLYAIAAMFNHIADAFDAPQFLTASTRKARALRFIIRSWHRWTRR